MDIDREYGSCPDEHAADQIRITLAYSNLDVKIGGAHGGISVGPDGATHQAISAFAADKSVIAHPAKQGVISIAAEQPVTVDEPDMIATSFPGFVELMNAKAKALGIYGIDMCHVGTRV